MRQEQRRCCLLSTVPELPSSGASSSASSASSPFTASAFSVASEARRRPSAAAAFVSAERRKMRGHDGLMYQATESTTTRRKKMKTLTDTSSSAFDLDEDGVLLPTFRWTIADEARNLKAAAKIAVDLILKPLVVSASSFPVATEAQMKAASAGKYASAFAWRSVENLCKDRRFADLVYVERLRWDATSQVFRVQLRTSSEDVAREICLRDGAYAVYGGNPARKKEWMLPFLRRTPSAASAAFVTDLVLLECRTPHQRNPPPPSSSGSF